MQFSVYTDTDWLYPDTPPAPAETLTLSLPRGGHAGAQLTLPGAPADARPVFSWDAPGGPAATLARLLPVGVNENTAPTTMTTTDPALCRGYVTRIAPFAVYDAICPLDEAPPFPLTGAPAFYLCFDAPAGAAPGRYEGTLRWEAGGEAAALRVCCRLSPAVVPPAGAGRLEMLNFFDYEGPTRQHGAAPGTPAYWALYRRYVRAQLDLRCTHILLPPGEAVRDETGRLTGFDFSAAVTAGRIAREEGAPYLCGGHLAHWHEWDDSEYYPNWDQKTGVSTPEGYLQLRLYFTAWADAIRENGWQSCMTQALADEPQTHNDGTYRILAAICRKFLPGIPIVDAVETTNLGGGIDIWVPKQDTYEKWRPAYEALKNAGETMWFYTCAFPAGPAMNRSMDLPLTVSRAVLWMGARYRLAGFLHWGFNYYIGTDIWRSACCPHKGALLPAGDAHIVYPGPDGPWRSLRFEAQRGGAEDYELLMQAIDRDPARADALIDRVCTDFRHYTASGRLLLQTREALLAMLEE